MADQTTLTEKELKALETSMINIEALHLNIEKKYERLRREERLDRLAKAVFNLAMFVSPFITFALVFPPAIPLVLVSSGTVLLLFIAGKKLFGKKITKPNPEQIKCYKDKQIIKALTNELSKQITLAENNINNKNILKNRISNKLAETNKKIEKGHNGKKVYSPEEIEKLKAHKKNLESLEKSTRENIKLNKKLSTELSEAHNKFEALEAQLNVDVKPEHTRWLDIFEINSDRLIITKKELARVIIKAMKENNGIEATKAVVKKNGLEQLQKTQLQKIPSTEKTNKKIAAIESKKPSVNLPKRRIA